MGSKKQVSNGLGDVRPQDLEASLLRIPGVSAARVVIDGNKITEVHILASTGRSPKQIVRDVQSVVLTTFAIEVDYRTVSVVQLEGEISAPQPVAAPEASVPVNGTAVESVPAEEPPHDVPRTIELDPGPERAREPETAPSPGPEPVEIPSDPVGGRVPEPQGFARQATAVPVLPATNGKSGRPILIKVNSSVAGHAAEVTVSIKTPEGEMSGSARGPASTGPSLVCRAVANGVAALLGDAAVDIEVAKFVEAGNSELAVCVMNVGTRTGEVSISGSAMVRRDPQDAMARATLAALNRLIGRSTLHHD